MSIRFDQSVELSLAGVLNRILKLHDWSNKTYLPLTELCAKYELEFGDLFPRLGYADLRFMMQTHFKDHFQTISMGKTDYIRYVLKERVYLQSDPQHKLNNRKQVDALLSRIHELHDWNSHPSVHLYVLREAYKHKYGCEIPKLGCPSVRDMFETFLKEHFKLSNGLKGYTVQRYGAHQLRPKRKMNHRENHCVRFKTTRDQHTQTDFITLVHLSTKLLTDCVLFDLLQKKYPTLTKEVMNSIQPLSPNCTQITDRKSTAPHQNEQVGVASCQTDVTPEDDLIGLVGTDNDVFAHLFLHNRDLLKQMIT